MEKAIWFCIIINVLAGIGLLVVSLGPGQDAAGKSMMVLPVLLLFVLSLIGYFLLRSDYYGWAMTVTGIPAVIVILILAFTLLQGFKSK